MTVKPRLGLRRRVVLPALAAGAAATVAASLLLFSSTAASAQEAPVNLGTAADFSVLAGAEPTNTGPSFLAQSLGRFPGSTAAGFETATIGGEIHLGDAVALQAQSDLTIAFNDAAGRTRSPTCPRNSAATRSTKGSIGSGQPSSPDR
ncbi:ice-binding family protein [Micromonospora zamorensis]|uniref:Ice-binding family protein n=1 Tax=Micromonospora zamorensis TaxID=709883 RepID=A0ABZ1PRL6_9ACTN|nr:ice-binding family protein [Micromonospora zamorensis]